MKGPFIAEQNAKNKQEVSTHLDLARKQHSASEVDRI